MAAKKPSNGVSSRQNTLSIDFEKSLTELENLVEQLESGELTLEEALKHFERGIGLARQCQNALQQAEQKVEQLSKKNGQIEILPLPTEDNTIES